jgi:excisionase family DNA binding protein
VAARLNLQVCTVYGLVANGDVTALRFGRKLRIRPGAVDALVTAREQPEAEYGVWIRVVLQSLGVLTILLF